MIRAATKADAAEIARVHVASMRVAYAEHEVLARITLEDRIARVREALAEGRRILVTEEDAEIVAFASFGPSRDGDASDEVGEVYAIYAHPSAWGFGVGRRLIAAATDALREAGFAEATLWVLGTNDRARRFYERAGWTLDGGTKIEEWLPGLTQLRYRRSLSDA